MDLSFHPRRNLVDALQNGFGPVPGYEYRAGERTFLLIADGSRRSLSEAREIAAEIDPPAVLCIGPPKPRNYWRLMTTEKRDEVRAWLDRGESHRRIRKELHVSSESVVKIRNGGYAELV